MKNKILVIGPPGSGKTYFSNVLGKYFELPVIHLDDIYYQNEVAIKANAFDNALDALLLKDRWIMDGHYFFNLNKRINSCDMIYFLDLPKEEIYQSLLERKDNEAYKIRGIKDFDKWFDNYSKNTRKEIYNLINTCQKETIIFKSRKEVNKFIETLK